MKKILGFLTIITLFIVCQTSIFAAETDYAYTISDLYFTDLNLNSLDAPANGCYANIKVRKTAENNGSAYVVCALYDKNNIFINSSFMYCDSFSVGETKTFGTTINVPSGKVLGKVKAFVVSDMKSLTPLSVVKCVLTSGEEYTNVLTVKGYINATARSDGLRRYKPNEGLIYVTATPLGGEDYGVTEGTMFSAVFASGDVPEIFTRGSFTVVVGEDDTYTVAGFVPDTENTVEYDSRRYAEDTIGWNGDTAAPQYDKATISFYTSDTFDNTKRYNLNTHNNSLDVDLVVNGVHTAFNKSIYDKYIVNNANGKIILRDMDDDGLYDIISVDWYATAEIGTVVNNKKLIFSKISGATDTSVILDSSDQDMMFKISYNNSEITAAELMPNDILSIKYNVLSTLADSEFYEIYVSRRVEFGQYTESDSGTETFTIGGNKYRFADGYTYGCNTLILGNEYKLYLDYFGNIFDVEITNSNINYAILDRYFRKSSGDDYCTAVLYKPDGTTVAAQVDLSASAVRSGIAAAAGKTYTPATTDNEVRSDLQTLVYGTTTSIANADKVALKERVVRYRISKSSGMINSLSFEYVKASSSLAGTSYNEGKKTLGSIKLGSYTKIIDATDYELGTTDATYTNLKPISIASLKNNREYEAYAFGEMNKSDKSYPFVIIVSAGAMYDCDTSFAVVNKAPNDAIIDDEVVSKTDVFYNNQKQTIIFDGDTKGYSPSGASMSYEDLRKGDVIVFSENENGRVKVFDMIATAASLGISESTLSGSADQSKTFMDNAFAETPGFMNTARLPEFKNWTGKWANSTVGALGDISGEVAYDKEVTRVVFGAVIDSDSNGFTLASIGNETSGVYLEPYNSSVIMPAVYTGLFSDISAAAGTRGSTIDIRTSSDTNVYTYDFANSINSSARLQAGGAVSTGASDYYTANNGRYYPWSNGDYNKEIRNCVAFALVRMVDEEARDILLIQPTEVR